MPTCHFYGANFKIPPIKEGGELDFQKLLGKFPSLPWAKYKGEKHLPGHNFTGAQTDLIQRLDDNNNVKDNKLSNK